MARTAAEKFRISPGSRLLVLNAPAIFRNMLGELPAEVRIGTRTARPDVIFWFLESRSVLLDQLNIVLKEAGENVLLWVLFPKASSNIQTDLTRDEGWEALKQHPFRWMTLVSFDPTWSAFLLKKIPENAREQPRNKALADNEYIDKVNKKIILPEDVEQAFSRSGEVLEIFKGLAFSHRKEYVEWIISAKKQETRSRRIDLTIEKLQSGRKNPYAS